MRIVLEGEKKERKNERTKDTKKEKNERIRERKRK